MVVRWVQREAEKQGLKEFFPYNLSNPYDSVPGELGRKGTPLFQELIALLASQGEDRKPVILIDEYDLLLNERFGRGERMDDLIAYLADFYATFKQCQSQIHASYVTGINRLTGIAFWSKFNNIKDITLDEKYATLCGFTEEEIETNFPEMIEKICRVRKISREDFFDQIRNYYNGYCFTPGLAHKEIATMYNPWSMVNFLCSATLCDYWYGQASLAFILPRLEDTQNTIDTLFEKKAIEFTAGNIGQLHLHAQNQMTFKSIFRTILSQGIMGQVKF